MRLLFGAFITWWLWYFVAFLAIAVFGFVFTEETWQLAKQSAEEVAVPLAWLVTVIYILEEA